MLGPLEVAHGDRLAGKDGLPGLGGPRQRAVLAMLALAGHEVVSTDRIVDGLWGEDPPAKPLATLQVFVHKLRKALEALEPGAEHLLSRPPGYVLAPEVTTDVQRFEALLAEARGCRARGDEATAAGLVAEALALWRGDALADVADHPFAEGETVRLDELRWAAEEDAADSALRLGRHQDLVATLEERVREQPTRERRWGQLMVALYRTDRQADALAAYARARDQLADELGIDPGQALQQLELAILRQDPTLAPPDAAAPAARVPQPRPPAQVPRPATTTFGRDDMVEQVRSLLDDPAVRLVSLTGPGGSGKSRVAHLAAAPTDSSGSAAVHYLTATEETDPAQLLTEVAALVSGQEPDPADPTAVLEASPPALVVLDNLEALSDAAGLVGTLLEHAPGLTLLVTTRLPLQVRAEHVVPVPPLPVPGDAATEQEVRTNAAVQLFLDRARAGAGSATADDQLDNVAALVRFLDGLPLALELAAARTRLLAPRAVLERLSSDLGLLTSTSPDLPPRQRTLTTTLEWSYERLSPEARLVCDRLALFERAFSVEALEAVCPDVPDVVEALTALLDARLIRAVESRVEVKHVVLGTVRAFARGRLATYDDLDACRERLARHLLSQVRRDRAALDGPGGQIALGRYDDEADDLAAAHAWAVDRAVDAAASGEERRACADLAVDLVLAQQDFWVAAGRLRTGLERVLRTQTLLGEERPEARAALHAAAAKLAYLSTDWERAEAEALQVLDLAPERAVEAEARVYLGGAWAVTGRPAEGAEQARRGLDVARDLGAYPLEAVAISMLAISSAVRGDYTAERAWYEERLGVVRAHGDDARLADTLNTLAEIALDEGDAATARLWAEESVRIAGALLPLERRDALISLARAAVLERDGAGAAGHLREALALGDRTGQSLAVAQCLRTGGCLAFQGGDAALAVRLFAAAQQVSPSPSGTDDPVEQDLASALSAAKEALGPGASAQWELGRLLPTERARAQVADLLEAALQSPV